VNPHNKKMKKPKSNKKGLFLAVTLGLIGGGLIGNTIGHRNGLSEGHNEGWVDGKEEGAKLFFKTTLSKTNLSKPYSLLDEDGIPKALDMYVMKMDDGFLSEYKLDKECRETHHIFEFDGGYVLHKKGWDHVYVVDVGMPGLPIREGVKTKEERNSRVGEVFDNLLKALKTDEVDVHKDLVEHGFRSYVPFPGQPKDKKYKTLWSPWSIKDEIVGEDGYFFY